VTPPVLFALAESCHGLKACDGTTAVDNKDRRASFKTIDEGAETVFSLSDAGFFHPARIAESIGLFKSHCFAAMLTRWFGCRQQVELASYDERLIAGAQTLHISLHGV
jgi:hypothetical protein